MLTQTIILGLAVLSGLFTQVALAAPSVEARDVYAPPILYPRAGTVWYSGTRHNVTWDVSKPPQNITNPIGKIYLRKGKRTTSLILAKGFNIRKGRVEVKVPWVDTASNYQVVLIGDSGDFSQKFTIISDY